MKTKLKYIVIASLIFGASGFNSVKAITADELLVAVQQFAGQVVQAFTIVSDALNDHETRIGDNESRTTALESADYGSQITGLESRIASLEAEPKATIAATAPTEFDDINAGFTEGSVWVDMPNKDAYILVDSAPGAAVWEPITNKTIFYSIGDTGPAGGIVFHVTDGGLHGLEVSPVDQGAAQWGCPFTAIPGADGTAIGTGAQNTADILAGCAESGFAASLADAYTLNGFDDWFLPSQDELNELYLNQGVVGGFVSNFYWSSSEDSLFSAWVQNFGSGNQFEIDKITPFGVRAVRAF